MRRCGQRLARALQVQSVTVEREPRIYLKYAIEVQIPRSMRMLGMLEPFMELVVYEDIPINLAAIKRRVEDLRAAARIAELESQGECPCASPAGGGGANGRGSSQCRSMREEEGVGLGASGNTRIRVRVLGCRDVEAPPPACAWQRCWYSW
jgi:hypothetical protein